MINNKNLKVYIYCNSGISRSPTVIMTYLCIYKKTECWEYLPLVEALIQKYVPFSQPNVAIVQKALSQGRILQDQQQFKYDAPHNLKNILNYNGYNYENGSAELSVRAKEFIKLQ